MVLSSLFYYLIINHYDSKDWQCFNATGTPSVNGKKFSANQGEETVKKSASLKNDEHMPYRIVMYMVVFQFLPQLEKQRKRVMPFLQK